MTDFSGSRRNFRRRHGPVSTVMVPVGVEKILYYAAHNTDFKNLLLSDRGAALASTRIGLLESEETILMSIGDEALAQMIDGLQVRNPMRRRFMKAVATAAATLVAGTAVMSCDDKVESKFNNADAGGCDTDCDMDTDTDSDSDVDTDTDTDSDTDSDTDTDTDADAGADAGDAGK